MFQQTQPKEKIIQHDIPIRQWDVAGMDMFSINNNNYICIVDYHSKFPIIKKIEDLLADSLILTCKVIFFRLWHTQKNNVICWWKCHFRKV